MEIRYFKHYSGSLNRDMEFKVYGHRGMPVLFIPCQSGRFFDFENFHMVDHWAKWIEEGRCTVYSCDSIDDEAWAAKGADSHWRIENHERWYHYIVDELVPYIKHLNGQRLGYDHRILTFGCSLGAMHAANLFFRRPELFEGCFAISGLYDSPEFFGDYMDETLYNNCPTYYLANLPHDHFYMDMYRNSKILIVVGQGRWEEPLVESTRKLHHVLMDKGIPAQVDYWGFDVDHDWPWWYKMVEHYVPQLLN